MRRFTLALVCALCVLASLGSALSVTRVLPACEEDAVLIGTGAFDAGRWTAYVCGPAVDDYSEVQE